MDYEIIKWFKMNGFTVDVDGFRKNFIVVRCVNDVWYIGHTYWNDGFFGDGKMTKINYCDRIEWIKYFDRI